MYAYYPDDTDKKISIGGSEPASNWRLAIGSNFGVNSLGEVYASAGKFGNLNIIKDNTGTTKISFKYTDDDNVASNMEFSSQGIFSQSVNT
jgi:hypothetical protein